MDVRSQLRTLVDCWFALILTIGFGTAFVAMTWLGSLPSYLLGVTFAFVNAALLIAIAPNLDTRPLWYAGWITVGVYFALRIGLGFVDESAPELLLFVVGFSIACVYLTREFIKRRPSHS